MGKEFWLKFKKILDSGYEIKFRVETEEECSLFKVKNDIKIPTPEVHIEFIKDGEIEQAAGIDPTYFTEDYFCSDNYDNWTLEEIVSNPILEIGKEYLGVLD